MNNVWNGKSFKLNVSLKDKTDIANNMTGCKKHIKQIKENPKRFVVSVYDGLMKHITKVCESNILSM